MYMYIHIDIYIYIYIYIYMYIHTHIIYPEGDTRGEGGEYRGKGRVIQAGGTFLILASAAPEHLESTQSRPIFQCE